MATSPEARRVVISTAVPLRVKAALARQAAVEERTISTVAARILRAHVDQEIKP